MGEFASKGVAGSALGLGIAGLSVALLKDGGLGDILSMGGGSKQAALLAENAMLKAELNTDAKIAATYKACRDEKDALGDRLLEKYIQPMATEIADMRVREAQTGAAVDCLAKSTSMRFDSVYREIDCTRKEFGAAIALEGERRQSADDSILCYVKGTYVPGSLVMPASAICPPVMPQYNSWTAPTTTASTTGTTTG